MKTINKSFFLALIILFFANCKEKVDFTFDDSKVTAISDYSYEYEGDILISEIETHSDLMFNKVVDKNIFRRFFEYNNNGQLERETIYFNEEQSPDSYIYIYNSIDSLVTELSISSEGDTTRWIQYDYFPDGRQIVFSKNIYIHFLDLDPNIESDLSKMKESMDTKTYDTIVYRNEYLYESNLRKIWKQYDNNNQLEKIVEYEYDNKKLAKEKHYLFSNSQKILEKTGFYDYSKSINKPDYFFIGTNKNDTISKCINKFKNEKLIMSTDILERGEGIIITYYQDEKIIGINNIDKTLNYNSKELHSYYSNGNKKQVKRSEIKE
jgi:hypothetical protein